MSQQHDSMIMNTSFDEREQDLSVDQSVSEVALEPTTPPSPDCTSDSPVDVTGESSSDSEMDANDNEEDEQSSPRTLHLPYPRGHPLFYCTQHLQPMPVLPSYSGRNINNAKRSKRSQSPQPSTSRQADVGQASASNNHRDLPTNHSRSMQSTSTATTTPLAPQASQPFNYNVPDRFQFPSPLSSNSSNQPPPPPPQLQQQQEPQQQQGQPPNHLLEHHDLRTLATTAASESIVSTSWHSYIPSVGMEEWGPQVSGVDKLLLASMIDDPSTSVRKTGATASLATSGSSSGEGDNGNCNNNNNNTQGCLISDGRGLGYYHNGSHMMHRPLTPTTRSEVELYNVLDRANLLCYFDVFLTYGGDDVTQLIDADEDEFLEIMRLVGMTRKPLHVRRLQKALIAWKEDKESIISN